MSKIADRAWQQCRTWEVNGKQMFEMPKEAQDALQLEVYMTGMLDDFLALGYFSCNDPERETLSPVLRDLFERSKSEGYRPEPRDAARYMEENGLLMPKEAMHLVALYIVGDVPARQLTTHQTAPLQPEIRKEIFLPMAEALMAIACPEVDVCSDDAVNSRQHLISTLIGEIATAEDMACYYTHVTGDEVHGAVVNSRQHLISTLIGEIATAEGAKLARFWRIVVIKYAKRNRWIGWLISFVLVNRFTMKWESNRQEVIELISWVLTRCANDEDLARYYTHVTGDEVRIHYRDEVNKKDAHFIIV